MSGRLKIGNIKINIDSMLFNREFNRESLSDSKEVNLKDIESIQLSDFSNFSDSFQFDSSDDNDLQYIDTLIEESVETTSSEISNILVYSYDLSEFIKLSSIINDNIKGNQRLIKEDIIIKVDREVSGSLYRIKLKIDKNSETFITALGISSGIDRKYFVSKENMSYNLLNINNIEHGRKRLPRFYIKFRTTKAGFIEMDVKRK